MTKLPPRNTCSGWNAKSADALGGWVDKMDTPWRVVP
jgi:hypothetical protein